MIAYLEPTGIRSLKRTKLFKYLLLTSSISSSGIAKFLMLWPLKFRPPYKMSPDFETLFSIPVTLLED